MQLVTVWRIACNEWRRLWHIQSPVWLLAALLVLWAIAVLAAHHHWQDHARLIERINRQNQQDWQSQPDRHPHRVSHYGDFVAKPLHPLSVIEPGILDQSGHLVYLEAHRLNSANFNPASEATSLGRFPIITPAMIVLWWIPLCLVMMGYGCVTSEKGAGTLAFLRSNGASAWSIAAGKWVAYMLPMTLLLGLQAGLAAYWITGSEQAWGRLLLMLISQLTYVAVWCGLIILVSWVSRHLHSALLTLLLCWVCICVIFPRGLSNLAQIQYPTQPRSVAELRAEKKLKTIGDSHNPNDPYYATFKAKVLKQYGVASVEALPINYNGLVMQEGERLTTQVYREQQARHEQQLLKQNQWISTWLWLSPSLALQYLQMASSGNDIAHHHGFLHQSEERRYRLIQYLNQLHAHEVQAHDDKNTRISADFWKNAPRTPVKLPTLATSRGSIEPSLWVLLLWLLLTCALLTRVIHRV